MLTILFLAVGSVMVFVLVLLAVVVVAIKQEPQAEELAANRPMRLPRGFVACSVCMSASPTSLQPTTMITENRGLPPGNHPAGQKAPRNEGLSAVTPPAGHRDPMSADRATGAVQPCSTAPKSEGGDSHCRHTRSIR